MDDEALVFCGLQWLHGVHGRGAGALAVRLERIEDLDNGITVFGEGFLGHLHVHLGAVLLETQLGVLFKPPGRYLPLADSTQDWEWGCMVAGVSSTLLCETGQVVG